MKYICDHDLRRDLLDRLLCLNFHAFLRAITLLLDRMGYENIMLSGRTGWVGRNADGGYDLLAELPVPGGARRVVIQVKQYSADRPIFRRTVDELRGVCLRAGASEAILITTSTFSETLDAKRLSSAPLVPVRLIGGSQLADLMALHRVGIWEEAPASVNVPARRGMDVTFFDDLEASYNGVARPGAQDQVSFSFSLTITPRCRRVSTPGTKKAALPQRS